MNDSEIYDLEEELRVLIRQLDPVPAAVDQAARAALQWRSVDAELARLTYDSWVDERALTGVRGHDGRQLTFESPGLTLDVAVEEGTGQALIGQLSPPSAATVELRHRDGMLTVLADALGRFMVEHLPGGPISLRCRPTGTSSSVDTEWVAI